MLSEKKYYSTSRLSFQKHSGSNFTFTEWMPAEKEMPAWNKIVKKRIVTTGRSVALECSASIKSRHWQNS